MDGGKVLRSAAGESSLIASLFAIDLFLLICLSIFVDRILSMSTLGFVHSHSCSYAYGNRYRYNFFCRGSYIVLVCFVKISFV